MVTEQFELYLIRHGVAAERGDAYPDDTKRPLTNEGIQKLRKGARALLALDVGFDVILTSPLVRTRQTAETIAAVYKDAPPIVNVQALAPGGTHTAIIDELSKQHRRHRIAIVGHEPGISGGYSRRRSFERSESRPEVVDGPWAMVCGRWTCRWSIVGRWSNWSLVGRTGRWSIELVAGRSIVTGRAVVGRRTWLPLVTARWHTKCPTPRCEGSESRGFNRLS